MRTRKSTLWEFTCATLAWAALALPGFVAAQQPQAASPQPRPDGARTEEARTAVKSRAPAVPDVEVLDQDGRKLRFYSDLVQGRTVAINFIFTTCTTICPPLTANFAKVQKNMREKGEAGVRLISVSVDPENDTPERLKKYAELFHAGPGWTFVTGRRGDLEQIWKAFNIYLSSKQDHPPTVAVGNDVTHVWNYASGLTSAAKLGAVIEATLKGEESGGSATASGEKTPSRDSR
ncbi:MAG TPA: SCO family protein [Candidatus Angelobacter sp.]